MPRKKRRPEEVDIKLEKVVFDTSSIIAGKMASLLEEGKLDNAKIIIPEVVMGELQAQTARGKEAGFIGLEEIKKSRKLAEEHKAEILFFGERPSYENILLAKSGRLDALIQEIAKRQKAVLITSDLPQAMVAEAEGTQVKFFESYDKEKKIRLEDFWTTDTMSIHLKDGCLPYAKRGKPGNFTFAPIGKKEITGEELEIISKEIFDATRNSENSFVEIGEHGVSIIQLRDIRIAIARPPFASAMEITAVRPIIKLKLEDYKLSGKLKERLEKKAEGVLIAGPPGSGKSTFVASLAEFYFNKGKVVKTMESPRDLQVPKEITQYAPLDGSFAKTADILLLVRPDYVVFDEIRKLRDFEIFSDMRLAGIGLVGVVHASNPIDSVQRFLGKIDMGVIPHVIDTIIFIEKGEVKKVYSLNMTVRTPQGMNDSDLARPIVEVKDFETSKLEYEIYTYGDQSVVIPVVEEKEPAIRRLAKEKIIEEIKKFDRDPEIEWLSDNKIAVKVENAVIPRIIGKEGKVVKMLEERLGVRIDIEPKVENMGKEIEFNIGETGAYIVLTFDRKFSGKNANVYIEKEYLFTATVGRKGEIKVSKNSELGKGLIRAAAGKKSVSVFI